MSRRKENIRKSCNEIIEVSQLFIQGSLSKFVFIDSLLTITHRIKRTTWRGDETNLNRRITDDIKQIAMRSFKNDLSNVKLNNDHPPATDW